MSGRKCFFLVFLACQCLWFRGVGQSNPRDTLKVAIYDAPPFGYGAKDGSFGGLMVEIWEAVADELDWHYKYQLTDMDELLSGLQSQKYDVGMGAITKTT